MRSFQNSLAAVCHQQFTVPDYPGLTVSLSFTQCPLCKSSASSPDSGGGA